MISPARPFTLADYIVAVAMNLLWGLNIIATKYVVGATGPFMAAVVTSLCVAIIAVNRVIAAVG